MALTVRKIGDAAGGEILGLDFNAPLDPPTVQTIYQAFLDHHVVCIRDQDVSLDCFMQLAACFGDLQIQKVTQFAHPETPLVSVINPALNLDRADNSGKPLVRGASWHTDHSYTAHPCKATMLHALTVPSDGGDTRFLNMRAAFDALPDGLRREIEGKRGVHRLVARRQNTGRVFLPEERAGSPCFLHPLARTHDETGRKSIYINPNRMDGVEDLDEAAGEAVLDALEAHSFQPRFEYRHKWRKHDILIWDNRCLLHAATDDFSESRLLHRILLKGGVPA